MVDKHFDKEGLKYFWAKLKLLLASKADANHTHDRVNGYKIIVSDTAPSDTDDTVITFVIG